MLNIKNTALVYNPQILAFNGNCQLPRREELRSQCSLKKEHRSSENEMMGLSANVA